MRGLDGVDRARIWSVGALVQAVGDALSARFASCMVRGELSGVTRAASGHVYFTLKDEQGQSSLRCAMFRRAVGSLGFQLGDGMLVEVRGQLAVYEARGELQLVVDGLRQAGAGALYEQFVRLKARLEAEGLFDQARKRFLPRFPTRVGVITSPAAAAWQDVMTALSRRAPHVEIVLIPTAVQGGDAPAQIVRALGSVADMQRAHGLFDSVILCRGGGSLEDLWAFNDERVVRAVVACPVPLVCGVGHETDVTLADLAADLRAPTPTAAAELIAQDHVSALDALISLKQRLDRRLGQRLDAQNQRLDQASLRLTRPAHVLSDLNRQLALLAQRLARSKESYFSEARACVALQNARLLGAAKGQWPLHERRLDGLAGRLHALDPTRVLERGYAWLTDEHGRPVKSVQQIQAEDVVHGVLLDGVLQMRVTGTSVAPTRRRRHAKKT
jgi:exodeoxyribonuclease VII large subunit